jgi:hypothetical protein
MGFYDSNKVGEPDQDIELDLTNSHLHSLEDVEIKDTLEVRCMLALHRWDSTAIPVLTMNALELVQYVDLTANRLNTIEDRLLALQGASFPPRSRCADSDKVRQAF